MGAVDDKSWAWDENFIAWVYESLRDLQECGGTAGSYDDIVSSNGGRIS